MIIKIVWEANLILLLLPYLLIFNAVFARTACLEIRDKQLNSLGHITRKEGMEILTLTEKKARRKERNSE